MRPKVLALASAATLAMALAFASAGTAFAYGSADQPVAQLTLSANCDNPSFGLCQFVGLGGIWAWVEVDANHTGDMTGAECSHGTFTGAASIKQSITWETMTGEQIAQLGIPLFAPDPTDTYYVVNELGFAFPVTMGHYSFQPVPAVTLQMTVAP